MRRTKESCVDLTARLLGGAEKELAAYVRAVEELYGPDEARQSVEDWIAEMKWMDWPGEDASPDWRCLTIAAAKRLAGRLRESICVQQQVQGRRDHTDDVTRRQRLHNRIAAALEDRFPEIVSAQPALLAQHYADGGLAEKAAAPDVIVQMDDVRPRRPRYHLRRGQR